MHKMNNSLGKYRCDWCSKPIYEEYWLIPPKVKDAFKTLISMDEKKMCKRCYNNLSRKPKSAVKAEQLDAFPDYPKGFGKR